MFCPYCGRRVEDNISFCPYCGKNVQEIIAPSSIAFFEGNSPNKKGQKRKRKWTIIFVPVMVISIIIIGRLFVSSPDVTSDDILFDENNVGEIYFYQTEEEHIVIENDGYMYADNEVLVVANEGTLYNDVEKLASSYDAQIVGWIEQTGDYQLKLSKAYTKTELLELLHELNNTDCVESAYVNFVFRLEDKTANRDGFIYGNEWKKDLQNYEDCKGLSWGFEAIGTLESWDVLRANTDLVNPVRIGLIDNGFDTEHEDLGFAETFYSSIGEHGTHVAGTMAAKADNRKGICGVYPYGNGNLYGVAYSGICDYSENGMPLETTMFLKIAYAELVLRNVKVINSSLGFNYYNWPLAYTDSEWSEQVDFLEANTRYLADFLERLLDKGYDFVIVNAAGNDSDRDRGIVYDSKYSFWTTAISRESYPDVYDRIIVVGAVDSNFNICNFSNGGDRVDIYAPGETIFSTVPGDEYDKNGWSGTSMAAPHISGLAAMIWSINNNLTGNQVKELICNYNNFRCTTCNLADAYKSVSAALYTIPDTNREKSENGAILCWVVDAEDEDKKIENANVTVTCLETGVSTSTTTDNKGHFEIVLPEGNYSLEVKADGYEDYSWPDGNENYSNPIMVKNNGVNYLDDWIKMRRKEKDSLMSPNSSASQKNYYNSNGELIYYESYAYYDNGLLCSKTLHSVSGDGIEDDFFIWDRYTLLYLYDENGILMDTILDTLTKDGETDKNFDKNSGEIVLINKQDENNNSIEISIFPERESIEQEKFGVDSSKTEVIYGDAQVIDSDMGDNWAPVYLDAIFSEEPMYYETNCRFINLNDDLVPELWVDYGRLCFGTEFFTQRDGVIDSVFATYSMPQWIENENRLLISNRQMVLNEDEVYEIRDGRFSLINSGVFMPLESEENSDDNPDYDYYWNDEKVSESEYRKLLSNCFDQNKAENIHQNIYSYEQCKLLLQSIDDRLTNSFKVDGSGETNRQIPSDVTSLAGHHYKLYCVDSIQTWEEAKKYCENLGGYLAVITSKKENDFLYSLMLNEGYSSAYFGLSDSNMEGNWLWVDETELSYLNWHKGEPNSESDNEDYAMFYWKYSDGTWNDGDFSEETKSNDVIFICEWDN